MTIRRLVRSGAILPGLLVASIAGAAPSAPAPAPDCTTMRLALPPALSAWGGPRVPVTAASDFAAARTAAMPVDRAADVTLQPEAQLRFAATPGKTGGAGSHGGILAIDIARAGTYRVALGTRGWIDVVSGGVALKSVAHGHGPACSGIAKIVDFKLKPGRYAIQIAGAAEPRTALLVLSAR